MHPFFRYTASCVLLLCVMSLQSLPVHGQSMDMIRQQLMQQGGQSTEASGNIPSIQGDRGAIRISDTMPEGFEQMLPQQSEILLDHPVDPDIYVIGPGDLFGVYLWGSLEKNYLLRISPEGYLIVPTVGSIMVADQTISEASTRFNQAISENYDDLDVSLFLLEPRRFRLQVSGLVYVPGMHESHAMERVSDVIERAGLIFPAQENTDAVDVSSGNDANISPEATSPVNTIPESILYPRPDGGMNRNQHSIGRTSSMQLGRSGEGNGRLGVEMYPVFSLGENRGSGIRNIRIHRNGTVIEADLLRFLKLGDLDANPYVQSGDHIEVVPYADEVGIDGEVQDQGLYEFKEGDRIADLIGFAGGLTVKADSSRAELVRFDEDGRNLTYLQIDLTDALTGNTDNPAYRLVHTDRLYIRAKIDYKTFRDVAISGEVRYPGQYPIEKDGTTLSELVAKAGGFSGHENLGEALLLRRADFAASDHEYERVRQMLYEERSPQEQQYLRSYLRTIAGSVKTDFEKLFAEHDQTYDVALRDDDIIYIPMKREMVNVMGAVMDPGYFAVEDEEGYKYYLEKAGGYNWNADKRNVFIYKADTGQHYNTRFKKVPIDGGDTLFVMEKERRSFWSYFSEYSGYMTTVATIVLIALQASK